MTTFLECFGSSERGARLYSSSIADDGEPNLIQKQRTTELRKLTRMILGGTPPLPLMTTAETRGPSEIGVPTQLDVAGVTGRNTPHLTAVDSTAKPAETSTPALSYPSGPGAQPASGHSRPRLISERESGSKT